MKHKHNTRFNEDEFLEAAFEKRTKHTSYKYEEIDQEEPAVTARFTKRDLPVRSADFQ